MIPRLAKALIPRISSAGMIVMVIILGISFIPMVLVPGLQLASELVATTGAIKLVGEQQRNPTLIRSSLESMHERLRSGGSIQDSLDVLSTSTGKLDAAFREMEASRPASWFALVADTGAVGDPIAGKHTALLRQLWGQELATLNPVLGFKTAPYRANTYSDTELSDTGRDLDRDVNAALNTSGNALPVLDDELAVIATELQTTNARAATQLRLVMLMGLLIAIAFAVLVTILLVARQGQEASLREARQQTADILRTVKDGLFLLDQNLVIGTAYSGALEALFQRKDFSGLAFEDLLRNIVSDRTLSTAMKFVTILWAKRTNEKLVKSINPLGEVEVRLASGNGRFDTRYLQFDFHRVHLDGVITHVLVSVSDVSARVDLARELQAAQSQAQAQVDTLMGILHIDPAQLSSFLSDSNAAMQMINSVLREPARTEEVFRKKLDTLFRQAHSVKGEAAALGLSSIESRAHAFEGNLNSLREKPSLSGNDFLPLVIKLDDLLTHLQGVSDLVARLSRLSVTSGDVAHTSTAVIEKQAPQQGATAEAGVASALQQLAAKVATENNKKATLQCVGFEAVPGGYRRLVKDIAIQAVRNAIVHGIEPAADRLAAGKAQQGLVKLTFHDLSDAGYKLVIEDDGQGLSTERIKAAAVKQGFITLERAQTLDAKQVYSLLFRPGFSTVETVTKDAGRGVGMNLMADLIGRIGGRFSVATAAGKFTRFTLTMPRAAERADDTEAA
jgi:two-component system, chemotaxis family, sensor kinase CheA